MFKLKLDLTSLEQLYIERTFILAIGWLNFLFNYTLRYKTIDCNQNFNICT